MLSVCQHHGKEQMGCGYFWSLAFTLSPGATYCRELRRVVPTEQTQDEMSARVILTLGDGLLKRKAQGEETMIRHGKAALMSCQLYCVLLTGHSWCSVHSSSLLPHLIWAWRHYQRERRGAATEDRHFCAHLTHNCPGGIWGSAGDHLRVQHKQSLSHCSLHSTFSNNTVSGRVCECAVSAYGRLHECECEKTAEKPRPQRFREQCDVGSGWTPPILKSSGKEVSLPLLSHHQFSKLCCRMQYLVMTAFLLQDIFSTFFL